MCRTFLIRAVWALVLACTPIAGAQAQAGNTDIGPLLIPVTEGRGPGEHVVEFKIAADALSHRLPDDPVSALGQALLDKNRSAERIAAEELARQAFGDRLGVVSAAGTLAEHALWLDQFSSVNEAMAIVGLGLGFAQVARDAAAGRDDAALTGGIKTWMNFAISKWGWRSAQIGGVALFVVDIVLREWQSGITEIATDIWTCRYQAWYRAHPRSVGEWKAKIWEVYQTAETEGAGPFANYVDGLLNEYVARAFADELLPSYGECSGSSMGLEHSLVQRIVMAEHKKLLEQMLAAKVMPEIADRAFLRSLRAQIRLAETHLKPRLNKAMLLEVTAYGYPAGARVVMPLPAGGEWAGKLRDDGTFRAKLTKFAILKAGYPDTIRIETADGIEERKLAISGDRLLAMFGSPQTPVVARYTLSEGAGTCRVSRTSRDGSREQQNVDVPARAPQPVDFALLANGSWVFGQFDLSSGWTTASPGVAKGASISFGAPYFDAVSSIEDCSMGFLVEDTIAQGKCTIRRSDSKQVSADITLARQCSAPARLALAGVFASVVTGDMQYYPVEGAEGRAIVNLLKQSIRKGVADAPADLLRGMPNPAGGRP